MPPLVRRRAATAAVAGTNEAVFVVAISPQNADVGACSKSRRGRGRGSGHGHGLEYGAAAALQRRRRQPSVGAWPIVRRGGGTVAAAAQCWWH